MYNIHTIYRHINMAEIRIMVKAMKDGTERTGQGLEWDMKCVILLEKKISGKHDTNVNICSF